MELMSMLLFCAFAQLPLALGVHIESDLDIQVKFNRSVLNATSMVGTDTHQDKLNINASRKVNAITKIQPGVSDDRCKYCSSCVKKALVVHENPKENVKAHEIFKRSARNNFCNTETVEDTKFKSVKVTKYKTADEKVYAIKVDEINNQVSETKDGKSTCKVYSVKKAYPCESEESNLILMKRKVNKKKKSKPNNMSTATEKSITLVTSASLKKRKVRVDSFREQESFMPSIEDLY